MRLHVVAPLLALIYASTASADLVRIDFMGPVAAGSARPIGQVHHGFIVYDSDARQTGVLFNGPTAPPRFDGAINDFAFGGIRGIGAPNYIYVIDGPDGDSIAFVSLRGLSLIFYGEPDVLDSASLPAVFPQNWTYAAWEINPPAEPFSGGQTSAYSSTIVGPSPTADGESRVLLSANEGTDSATCGTPGNKCRSIGQAIRNARNGDTVLVEVGVYGDLNGNGILGEPGEEADRTGCGCVVHIDKAITVLAERGAGATMIDARSVPAQSLSQNAVVVIGVADASFGYSEQGFTVLASPDRIGISVRAGTPRVKIWGNRVSGGAVGISGAEIDIYDTEVTAAQGSGIILRDGGHVVNSVIARNAGDGLQLQGNFAGDGTAVIADNVFTGNVGIGIRIVPGSRAPTSITGNDIVRNGGAGIQWEFSGNTPPNAVVQDNNIFGNGEGCGISNQSWGLVWATDNYWGGLGVADRACNGPNATTVVDPVRTEPDGRFGP